MNKEIEKHTFKVGRLNFQGAMDYSQRLHAMPYAKHYVIDMQHLSEVTPFGMLYFSAQIRSCQNKRPDSTWELINHRRHTYAFHMGFFSSSGFIDTESNSQLNKDDENIRYIKISKLKIRDLHIEAGQGATLVQEVLEIKAQQMAAILTRGQTNDAYSILQFSLREIMRNVVEHSNADYIWYAAQYWPMRQYAELSILDEGIGIRSSLSRNPHLNLTSDFSALHTSLMPGISGVAYAGKPPNRPNDWANSGYGLFMLSELCSLEGEFSLSSGTSTLLRENGTEKSLNSDFSGTALRLGININSIGKFGEMMTSLNKKGEEIAKSDVHSVKKASSSSKQLTNKI